jgi:hypothetical protein
VKRGLLDLHLLNQFLDPLKQSRIGYAGRQETVMLNFTVDFNALLTHGFPAPATTT